MIHVFRPVLRAKEILDELAPVLESGWIGLGPKTALFEEKFAEYIGVKPKTVVATNSCTSALHLAVKSLHLPRKARVLTTPITFVSTNTVLLQSGLQPVFYDIDPLTGGPSLKSVIKLVDAYQPMALVIVHIAGAPCKQLEELNALAQSHGIKVIEDCAHAAGASYANGMKVGNSDNVCCFSFHAVKNLPIGDGGIVVSKSEHEWMRKARWLGIDKDTASRTGSAYKWEYEQEFSGWKYHMNDIAATIGLVQLRYLDEDNFRRKKIAARYAQIPRLSHIHWDSRIEPACHFYPVFAGNRNALYSHLCNNGVYPGMHYKRNDMYRPFRKCRRDDVMSGAQWWEDHEITLPIHLAMSDQDVEKVVEIASQAEFSR